MISVHELVEERFSKRTFDEKLQILLQEKPKPRLSLSAIFMNSDGVGVTIYFDYSLYDQVSWLTGSEKFQSLFCWPCLLFSSGGMWTKAGVSDLLNLQQLISEHERTCEHIQAVLDFQMFIKGNNYMPSDLSTTKINDQLHNDLVKRNRELLKRITDVVCSIAMKVQTLKNKTTGFNEVMMDDCVTVLQYLKNYDNRHIEDIDDVIEILRIEPKILSDLVDAVSAVVKEEIKQESQKSAYISFIMSEHLNVASKSQVSTILRYLKGNEVCERFIGFTNFQTTKTSDSVFQYIKSLLSEFEMRDRWIAYAFDGGTLPPNELPDLLYKLKTIHSRAIFAPYRHHDLVQVLQQSFSQINDCTLFFKMINSIADFFEKENRWKTFGSFVDKEKDEGSTLSDNWYSRSRIINSLNVHRTRFIRFFEPSPRKNRGPDDMVKTFGFHAFLQELKTVFFLKLFDDLLESVVELNEAVRSQTPEIIFSNVLDEKLKNDLVTERDTAFKPLWYSVSKEVNSTTHEAPKKKRLKTELDDSETVLFYSKLHSKIINHMIQEIELRFEHLHQLQFCNLLLSKENVDFVHTIRFIKKLMEFQGPSFDEEQIRSEITVLRSNTNLFLNKNIYQLYDFLCNANLKVAFKNLYSLAEFILTLPFKQVSSTDSSKTKEIMEWCYIPDNREVTGDVSFLFVEFDFVQKLKERSSFYDDVVNKFYELNKTMELI